jgi:hypothetical protein
MVGAINSESRSDDALPVCLGCGNPNRLVNLWDMLRYAIRDLYGLLLWIEHTTNWTYAEERRRGSVAIIDQREQKTISDQVLCIRKHCVEMELHDAIPAVDELSGHLDQMSLGECRGHLLGIRRMLTAALENRVFMYVPTRFAKYAQPSQRPANPAAFQHIWAAHGGAPVSTPSLQTKTPSPTKQALWLARAPFGELVWQHFKGARYDAQEVSLCLIAGVWTAAIFHMMRVVEWGVRALGEDLGVRKIREAVRVKVSIAPQRKVKKQPAYKLKPIDHCTWEMIQGHLRKKADGRLGKLRPGPSKDQKQAFYATVFQSFHGFRDAWRNHVMHSREVFKEEDAIRVLGYVEDFMKTLAQPATKNVQ